MRTTYATLTRLRGDSILADAEGLRIWAHPNFIRLGHGRPRVESQVP